MTDITEIKRDLEALTAKVAKLEAERAAPRRNWPEKVEAGMVFRGDDCEYIFMNQGILVNLATGWSYASEDGFGGDEASFTYLGHARDILTIRTDAREPTGVELVGKVVKYYGMSGDLRGEGLCVGYDHESAEPYKITGGRGWFNLAKLTP